MIVKFLATVAIGSRWKATSVGHKRKICRIAAFTPCCA